MFGNRIRNGCVRNGFLYCRTGTETLKVRNKKNIFKLTKTFCGLKVFCFLNYPQYSPLIGFHDGFTDKLGPLAHVKDGPLPGVTPAGQTRPLLVEEAVLHPPSQNTQNLFFHLQKKTLICVQYRNSF